MKTILIATALLFTITAQASEFFGSVTFNDMTLEVTLNDVTDKVTFEVSGPNSGWVSMGFGSQQMDGTYCIIANENSANITQERILGFHSYGTQLGTSLIFTESYNVNGSEVTYVISRDLTVSGTEAQAYDFVAHEGSIDLILAYGNTTAAHHAARFFGTINFERISVNKTKETIVAQELKVFPNPTTEKISVQLDKASATSKVSIYDLQGKLMKESEFVNQALLEMDVANIAAGSYMIKVKGANFLSSSIFVKK